MTTPFEVQHTLTREQLKENLTMLYDRILKPQRILITVGGAFLILIAPFSFAEDLKLMLLFLVLGFYFFVTGLFFYTKRLALLQLLISKDRYKFTSIRYVLSDSEIQLHFSDPKYKTVAVPYDALLDIAETDNAFHLLNKKQTAIILPKSAFSLDSMNDLRAFIKEKTDKEFILIK